jgi:hypothetical protein
VEIARLASAEMAERPGRSLNADSSGIMAIFSEPSSCDLAVLSSLFV